MPDAERGIAVAIGSFVAPRLGGAKIRIHFGEIFGKQGKHEASSLLLVFNRYILV